MSKTTYGPAPTLDTVIKEVAGKYHPHLDDVKIVGVFRSKAGSAKGKEFSGRAVKVAGLYAFLADGDRDGGLIDSVGHPFFAIEVSEEAWKDMTHDAKRAQVDHLLCHCKCSNGELSIVGPDVSEFADVIDRHGLWRRNQLSFGKACAKAMQGSLPFSIDGVESNGNGHTNGSRLSVVEGGANKNQARTPKKQKAKAPADKPKRDAKAGGRVRAPI